MAFIEETQLFTDSGWKNIKDISGFDKLLVRNFLGEAEFTQPFALKKRHFEGEIVKLGGKHWSMSVTPDHTVVYERYRPSGANKFISERADQVSANENNRINRKFRYFSPESYKKETIALIEDTGKRYVTISNEDWFVLCAYMLCRGSIKKYYKRPWIQILLDLHDPERDIRLLGDILDRIGVYWSVILSQTDGRHIIRVSVSNTLAARLQTRLGSDKRKEMYIPHSMIYNCTKELATLLMETIISLSKNPTTERGDYYQFTSNNEKLIESLSLLGTLWGYGTQTLVMAKKGETKGLRPLKKDVLTLRIRSAVSTCSPSYKKTEQYKGLAYEIDLFEGQVYVREKGMPVWVNPK